MPDYTKMVKIKKNYLADDSQSTSLNHSQSLEAAEEIEIDYRDLRDSVKKVFLSN